MSSDRSVTEQLESMLDYLKDNIFARIFKYLIMSIIALVASTITIVNHGNQLCSFAQENAEIIFLVLIVTLFAILIVVCLKCNRMRRTLFVVAHVKNQIFREYQNFYFVTMSDYKNEKMSKESLTRAVEDFLCDMLDNLVLLLKAYSNVEFCSCIKVISDKRNPDNSGNIKVDDAIVDAFFRSTNLPLERKERPDINDSVDLVKESHFRVIVDDEIRRKYNKRFFYEQNMKKFEKWCADNEIRFSNSKLDYHKYYKAALAVPIRAKFANLHFKESEDGASHDIVGFLCVDTQSTKVLTKKNERYFIYIAQACAALAYLVLNKYRFYQNNLDRKQSAQLSE